jgi:hypothetical protein
MKEKTLIRDYTSKDKEAVLHLLKLNTPQYFAPSEENDLIDYLSNHIEQNSWLRRNQCFARFVNRDYQLGHFQSCFPGKRVREPAFKASPKFADTKQTD